jgi:hypothetical protein
VRTVEQMIHNILDGSGVPSLKQRLEIQRELNAHLEDLAAAARQAGHREHEIEPIVLDRFGDPKEVADGFSNVYSYERHAFLTLCWLLTALTFTSCLLVAILTVQTGLALAFGTPFLQIIAGRHTAIQALDISAFVAIYLGSGSMEELFERHRFEKAALLTCGIVAILIILCNAAGLHTGFLVYGLITGITLRIVRAFVFRAAARAGIVLACFALAGLGFALFGSQVSWVGLSATCVSWLAVGAGYLLMSSLVPRVDAAFREGLQRI